MPSLTTEIARRRTFAIVSHPDAGKTTLTEKLLLFGGAIVLAGAVKGRKAARHAVKTSVTSPAAPTAVYWVTSWRRFIHP